MPQLFQVLRCYKCFVFQVHQTKKSCKFACKLCGEKQSIKRHYGLGTAKDCRVHVQKLNGIRGEVDEIIEQNGIDSEEQEIEAIEPSLDQQPKTSKWSSYVDKEDIAESVSHKAMYHANTEVVLDVPGKHFKRNFKRKKINPNYEYEGGSSKNILPLKRIDHFDHENNESSNDSKLHSLLECDGSMVNSNPQHINVESEYVICKENEKKDLNKLMPPKTNSNSKWARFLDTVEEDNGKQVSSSIDNSESKPLTLFSLCDDTDLDDVLDI